MIEEKSHNKCVIDEARKLANDKEKFDHVYNDIESCFEEDFLAVICEWLVFFRENHKHLPGIYDQSTVALFWTCTDNELFRTQTAKERELSFEFYRNVFLSQTLKEPIDIGAALYLISVSLFYGKYPHLQIRPVNSGNEFLKGKLTQEKMESFFTHLFISNETPHFLTHNLPSLNLKEVEVLDFVLRGNSIDEFPNLPIKVSKEEATFFYNNIGQQIEINSRVLERGLFITKVVAQSKNLESIPNFFSPFSKTFDSKLNLMLPDVEFWTSAYNMISDLETPLNLHNTITFVEYLGFEKYENNVGFTLDTVTYKSILPKVRLWEEGEILARRERTKKYRLNN